jgi:carbonic anhydrase
MLRSIQMKRGSTLAAQVIGFVALSALSTGCSMFGGHGRSAKMARAMRPDIHEVKPNTQSECLAEDATTTTTTAAPASDVSTACATCACAATASAKTRGAAKQAAAAAPSAVASEVPAATARRVEIAGPAERQLQRLMDGNKRFVEGEADNDVWTRALTRGDIASVVRRATPLAVVIACSEGEVEPAALFDAMPGELLVISAPADITDDAVVATARDAVQQYEIPLIVVLGGGRRGPAALPTSDSAARQASLKIGGESADRDGQAAALTSVDRLVTSDASLGARVAAGRLKVVAASCEELNGQVSLALGSDAAQPAKTSVPEQVVQLSQE